MLRTLLLCLAALACARCASPIAELQRAKAAQDDATAIQLLAASDEWVAEDAARHLGSRECRAAVPELLALAQRASSGPRARAAAALAVAHLAPGAHDDLLTAALGRAQDPTERYGLAVAIGSSCSLAARAALAPLLLDADVLVARAAKKALRDCSLAARRAS